MNNPIDLRVQTIYDYFVHAVDNLKSSGALVDNQELKDILNNEQNSTYEKAAAVLIGFYEKIDQDSTPDYYRYGVYTTELTVLHMIFCIPYEHFFDKSHDCNTSIYPCKFITKEIAESLTLLERAKLLVKSSVKYRNGLRLPQEMHITGYIEKLNSFISYIPTLYRQMYQIINERIHELNLGRYF